MTSYPFSLPYTVHIADINYGGHVANGAVMSYFQEARLGYLAAAGPFTEKDIGDGCSVIIAEVRVRYLAELFLGDTLEIGVRTEKVKTKSFVQRYRLERGGTPAVEGTMAVVCFDDRVKQSRPLPAAFCAALAAFEGTGG